MENFHSDDERKLGDIFDKLSNLFGQKNYSNAFPIVSYLFFLKDGDRYISVKVKSYRENLLKLNISPSCLKDCCWREYKYLVSVIEDIRTYIQNYIQDVPETLRSFVISMVDNITVYDGKVNSIVFRNGLTHKFVFKPTSS